MRHAAKVTENELKDALAVFTENGHVNLRELIYSSEKIKHDLKKVKFDLENYSSVIKTWGDFTFLYCWAGGDWEFSITFIVYLDKDKKTLRAYIPSKGNPWNTITGEAFGNDAYLDGKFFDKKHKLKLPEIEYEDIDPIESAQLLFDEDVIKKDILDRVKVCM